MTLRKQAHSKRRGYGGQAVLEGVMIRGPRHATVVCRRPDGTIASQSKKLATAYTSRTQRIPFVRGVIALAETLHLGFWALIYSSNVALEEEGGDDGTQGEGAGITGALIILLTLAIAIGLFFLAPVFAGRWIEDQIDPDIIGVILEGVIRLALLLGYLFLIGQWSEMRRVFAYHGAEHKTIAAWEAMSDLSVAAVRPFSRASTVRHIVLARGGRGSDHRLHSARYATDVVAHHKPDRLGACHRRDRLRGDPTRRRLSSQAGRRVAVRTEPLAASADDAGAIG